MRRVDQGSRLLLTAYLWNDIWPGNWKDEKRISEERRYPGLPPFKKDKAHLALSDIKESINELIYYREKVFLPSHSPNRFSLIFLLFSLSSWHVVSPIIFKLQTPNPFSRGSPMDKHLKMCPPVSWQALFFLSGAKTFMINPSFPFPLQAVTYNG